MTQHGNAQSNLTVGQSVGGAFRVKSIKKRTVMSHAACPVIDATLVELDSSFENGAALSFFRYAAEPPAPEEWGYLFPQIQQAQVFPMWRPHTLRQRCVCLPYKIATPGGLLAVTQMLATENNTVVSAEVFWLGFPLINSFFVGFKPGMKERTEDLLIAGLGAV